MTKVLAVSDTHGRTERWREVIETERPDIVVHAGDHCVDRETMDELATFWVAGNNDWIGDEVCVFAIEGVKFALMHGHQANRAFPERWRAQLAQLAKKHGASALVYGHSHVQHVGAAEGIFALNPGSLELPRNPEMRPTYATFVVDGTQIKDARIVYFGD